MKTDIHPSYSDTSVRCSCGNTFTTKSTGGAELTIELCNECHPFFTGKQKLVDAGGRVERSTKSRAQDKGHADGLRAFVAAVASGGPAPVDEAELIETSLATIAVRESLQTGTTVQL